MKDYKGFCFECNTDETLQAKIIMLDDKKYIQLKCTKCGHIEKIIFHREISFKGL